MSLNPWFRRCDVKFCKTVSSQHVNVHSTPRKPELFKKWEEAVRCTGTRLPRTGRICEKHFDPRDIVEFGCLKKEREGSAGSELVVTENIKMRVLVHGAVPTRFEDEIAEYLKHKELHNDEKLESQIAIDTEKKSNPKKGSFHDLKPLKQNDNNNAPHTQQNTKIADKPLKSAQEILFEKVYTGQIEPRLPNKSWNVHNCQIPQKGIVFAELAELCTDHSVPPILRKSVLFDGSFNMKVYFLGKLFPSVEFNKPKSIRDLEELLRHINAFKICEGGPLFSELTSSKFACKDEHIFRWRHNSCEIRLKRGRMCRYCSGLCRTVAHRATGLSDGSKSEVPIDSKKRVKLEKLEDELESKKNKANSRIINN